MKNKLETLRKEFIEAILDGNYDFKSVEFERIHITTIIYVDGLMFVFLISNSKSFISEFNVPIKLFSTNDEWTDVLNYLWDKHIEPAKKENIAKQIEELQKQLV